VLYQLSYLAARKPPRKSIGRSLDPGASREDDLARPVGKGGDMVGIERHPRRSFWCVLLVAAPLALAACDSGGGESEGESKPAPKVLLPPVGFSATADGLSVKLSWSADPASAQIDGYEVRKNGRLLVSPTGSSTSYIDTEVRPGKTYAYEIRSKGITKTSTSEPATDEVKIRTPPLSEARLEGDFGITTRVVSESGYSTFERNDTGWRFDPKCRKGPCDVVWRDVLLDNVKAILKQKGKKYSGEYHGYFGVSCGGSHSSSSVEVTFTVVRARALADEWRATKIEGTVDSSEVPQFGCTSGRASVAVKGSLRGG
jgi:hypothetical protein